MGSDHCPIRLTLELEKEEKVEIKEEVLEKKEKVSEEDVKPLKVKKTRKTKSVEKKWMAEIFIKLKLENDFSFRKNNKRK